MHRILEPGAIRAPVIYMDPHFSAEGTAKCCATITAILSSGLFPKDIAKDSS